jgi:hypothetical protein
MEGKIMRLRLIAGAFAALLSVVPGTAMAASCFDLWYARNAIYDDNGFCFKTDLALQYFDNADCSTRHPKFSKAEQKTINAIVAEEKRRHCKVN